MAITGAQETKPNPPFLILYPGHIHWHAIGQSKSDDQAHPHGGGKVESRDRGCGCRIPWRGVKNWDNDPASAARQQPLKMPKQWSGMSNTLWVLDSSVSEALSQTLPHFHLPSNPLKVMSSHFSDDKERFKEALWLNQMTPLERHGAEI